MMPSCGPSPTCHRMVYIKFPDIFVSTAITKNKDSEIVLPPDIASMMTEPGCFQRSGATWRPKLCALHWELPMNVLGRNSFIVVLSSGTLGKQEWFQQKQSCCNLSLIFWCWCCEFFYYRSCQYFKSTGAGLARFVHSETHSENNKRYPGEQFISTTQVSWANEWYESKKWYCHFFNFLSII